MKLSFSECFSGAKKTWSFFCVWERRVVCLLMCVCLSLTISQFVFLRETDQSSYKVAFYKQTGHRAMWRDLFEPLYCVIESWLDDFYFTYVWMASWVGMHRWYPIGEILPNCKYAFLIYPLTLVLFVLWIYCIMSVFFSLCFDFNFNACFEFNSNCLFS